MPLPRMCLLLKLVGAAVALDLILTVTAYAVWHGQ
jgi:hypothetical protein